MDITQAARLLERVVAQAEATLVIRDVLNVAKNVDRLSREAEVVLKKRQEAIAQADERIKELAKQEAAAIAKAQQIVSDAVEKSKKIAADAAAELAAYRKSKMDEISDVEGRLVSVRADLDTRAKALVTTRAELRQALSEKQTALNEKNLILESMKKLVGSVR